MAEATPKRLPLDQTWKKLNETVQDAEVLRQEAVHAHHDHLITEIETSDGPLATTLRLMELSFISKAEMGYKLFILFPPIPHLLISLTNCNLSRTSSAIIDTLPLQFLEHISVMELGIYNLNLELLRSKLNT